MFVRSVTIEGMHNVFEKTHYDFKKVTNIYGRNGSGKSTILQAIQYALLGYVPGTNKTKSAIFQHCNGKKLSIELELEDAGSIFKVTRSLIKSGSKIDELLELDPEYLDLKTVVNDIELPIFNTSDFYGLTPNMMKDWFINFFPSENDNLNWSELLYSCAHSENILDMDDSIDEKVKLLSDNPLDSMPIVDQIKTVNSTFKSSLTYEKQSLQRLQNTIQSMILYDDIDMSIDINDIESKINMMKSQRDNILLKDSKKKELQSLMIQKDELIKKFNINMIDTGQINNINIDIQLLDQKIAEFIKNKDDKEADKSKLDSSIYRISNNIEAIKGLSSFSGTCPITGSICNNLVEDVTAANEKLKDFELELKPLLDSKKQIVEDIKNISNMISQMETRKQEYKLFLKSLDTVQNRITLLESELEGNTDYIDVSFIDSELSALQDTKVKFLANLQHENLYNKLVSDKLKLESEIDLLKLFIKFTGVNGLQNKYAKSGVFDKLEEYLNPNVAKLFGYDASVQFNVSEKANSFSFGLLREDSYVPYNMLSSGEKCLFSICLLTSLLQNSDTKLKLVMIDDMLDHIDAENLSKLVRWVKNNDDVQYIFASVDNIDVDGYSLIPNMN